MDFLKKIFHAGTPLVFLCSILLAQQPHTISYQGLLVDSLGRPGVDSVYTVTFSIFNEQSGGTAAWSETKSLQTKRGIFATLLGDEVPFNSSVDFSRQLYLSIQFESIASTQRMPLSGVGSSYYANVAGTANAVANESIDSDAIVNEAVTSQKLAPAAVTLPKIDVGAAEEGAVLTVVEGVASWNTFAAAEGDITAVIAGEGLSGGGDEGEIALSIPDNAITTSKLATASVWTEQIADAAVTTTKIDFNVVSSINGVTNQAGNIDLVAGENVILTSDDVNNSITISADVSGESVWSGSEDDIYYDDGAVGIGTIPEVAELQVSADTHSLAVHLDGGLDVSGDSSAVLINPDAGGDSAVNLPVDAVSSIEIQNEAGGASAREGTDSIALVDGLQTLISRTLVAPSDGYVVVLATVQAIIEHDGIEQSMCEFGVSNTQSVLPSNQDIRLRLDEDLPSGDYDFPITVQALFNVPAGGTTFHLLGNQTGGSFYAHDMQLSLIFLPTAYGTIDSITTDNRNNTPDELAREYRGESQAVERASAIQNELSRMESELEMMRKKIETLRNNIKTN